MIVDYQIFAENLYDGEHNSVLHNRVVTVRNGRIIDVAEVDSKTIVGANVLHTKILAPGFIDIQINGAGDVMFNDFPEVRTLETMCEAARKGGTAYILPTFTTAPDQNFALAMDAVHEALKLNIQGVLGVHLEGPFLSREKPGIHPPHCIRAITEEDLRALLKPMLGIKLVTLAPEEDKIGAIRSLTDRDWIVFAGHSNATAQEMQTAENEGLSGATHLFNAMSQVTVREPGVAGYVMNNPDIYAGIIADGHHVHALNINMAYRLMGPERLILVTDAMQTLAGESQGFSVAGNEIKLQDGRLVDAKGTLAGAHLAMDQAIKNAVNLVGIDVADALKMASTVPAAALALHAELGKIKPNYRASLTMLDENLTAEGVMVDGVFFKQTGMSEHTPQAKHTGGLHEHH